MEKREKIYVLVILFLLIITIVFCSLYATKASNENKKESHLTTVTRNKIKTIKGIV